MSASALSWSTGNRAGAKLCCGLSTMISRSLTYDIVVSGGGMVGAAAACALAKEPRLKGKSILLLESSKKITLPQDFSAQPHRNRVSALSASSKDLLARVGAWEKMAARRIWPVKHMQVWEACSDALITFDKPADGNNLAHIVENDVTVAALYECLDELGDRVETRYGAVCTGYTRQPAAGSEQSFVNVHLKSGETLTTRLLIGADGHKSLVRRDFRIADIAWEYQQAGVVATLTLSSSASEELTNFVAWQRFLPQGPIALLPWDNSHKNSAAERLGNVLGNLIGKFLAGQQESGRSVSAAASGWQLPPTVLAVDSSSRASFPLGLMHATNYAIPRVALIGDAAHRIHPLAGQGVNLGFGDVTCLVQAIADAAAIGSDVGALAHLQKYESQRQRHVLPTLATMDGLNRLYATTFSPVVLARTMGLMVTNAVQPLKAYMMSHAAS